MKTEQLTDTTAKQLEKRGLWRRATHRWPDVMSNTANEKMQDAAVLRRSHYIHMANSSEIRIDEAMI